MSIKTTTFNTRKIKQKNNLVSDRDFFSANNFEIKLESKKQMLIF